MSESKPYVLAQDRKGMVWDLLLYVPTVALLLGYAAKVWFSGSQPLAYLLFFLGFFFIFVGANRVLGRLMLLPSSPASLACERDRVSVGLRNGERVDLVKDVRFYADYAGKSFGLSGMDLSGRKRQYVFHRGQFGDDTRAWQELLGKLGAFK